MAGSLPARLYPCSTDSAPRQEIQAICDEWMSSFSALRVELTKAVDIPDENGQDDEVFYLDLSGFFALNSRLQCDIHGFSYQDLVVLFERLRPHMHTIFIGADRGVEEAVLRHQKHMQAHV